MRVAQWYGLLVISKGLLVVSNGLTSYSTQCQLSVLTHYSPTIESPWQVLRELSGLEPNDTRNPLLQAVHQQLHIELARALTETIQLAAAQVDLLSSQVPLLPVCISLNLAKSR